MKNFLLFLICFISLSAEVIQPKLLEKMNKNRSDKFRIFVTMKEQFTIEQIRDEQRLYDNDSETIQRIIDTLKQKTEKSQSICSFLQTRNVEKLHYFWVINAISLVADAETIQELAQCPEVEKIILSEKKQYLTPVDSDRADSGAWGISYIHADEAQNLGITGEGIIVAVIDSGVDLDHPAFAPGQILVKKAWYPKDSYDINSPEDEKGHGTHVAGIIGSSQYGVAPKCKVLPVRVLDADGSGYTDEIIAGVEYAMKNADVLNMSFGGPAENIESSDEYVRRLEIQLHDTLIKAISLNKVCVIAAGNNKKIDSPAILPEAITVGAIDSYGVIASFSGCGPAFHYNVEKPEVVAPGVSINSTWLNGGTNIESGTSQATPHVAGVVALMLSINKKLTPEEVKTILQNTAFGTAQVNSYGAGCVDALAAVNATPEPPLPDQSGKTCGMLGLEFIFAFLVCFLLKRKM